MNVGQSLNVATGLTTFQPQILTTAGTNVYVTPGGFPQQFAPVASKEPTPLGWLRDQVDEVCELARAA